MGSISQLARGHCTPQRGLGVLLRWSTQITHTAHPSRMPTCLLQSSPGRCCLCQLARHERQSWLFWQVEWAHLDIAGPCWDDKAGGATGFGALTLAEWAIAQGKPQ